MVMDATVGRVANQIAEMTKKKSAKVIDLGAQRKRKRAQRVVEILPFSAGYYTLDGREPKRVSMREWAPWFEAANRRVARTNITPKISVSTIFLGLDHSFGAGPPILFETMVFGGALDRETARYSTYDEAEAGHAAMVERVKCASSPIPN